MNKERTSNLASILIALSFVAIGLIGYLGFLFFRHNILPLKYRWIIIGVLVFLALLLLIWGLSHAGSVSKVLGIFLCSLLLFFLELTILYAQSGVRALDRIQSADENRNNDNPKAAFQQDNAYPAKEVSVAEKSFVVYISGIDTFGKLETVSRSDVNIIAVINPKTRHIRMVSVPRDSYLPIAGEGLWENDKLTHAGMYGIGTSIETLEKALGISVNYFARLNFTSFMNVIDAVGGVSVHNPESFTSIDGQYYPEGEIELSAETALMYVRERYNLTEGDFGRQKNQERVIEAVFRKILSPQLVLRFQGIMATLSDSIQTNMPANSIMEFVNQQIDEPGDWVFDSVFLTGDGAMGLPSFAMPDSELWFFVIDENSLADVKQALQDTLNGVERQTPAAQPTVREDADAYQETELYDDTEGWDE